MCNQFCINIGFMRELLNFMEKVCRNKLVIKNKPYNLPLPNCKIKPDTGQRSRPSRIFAIALATHARPSSKISIAELKFSVTF
jgi:hypothetical protein